MITRRGLVTGAAALAAFRPLEAKAYGFGSIDPFYGFSQAQIGRPSPPSPGSLLPLNSRLVFEGDSITAGSSGPAFTQFAITRSRGRCYCPIGYNQGTGGNTAAQMASQVASVTALNPKVVVLLGGTNDLSGTADTASTVFGNLRTCIDAYKAAGARVINVCVLPRNDASWDAGEETRRNALNALILAQTDVSVVNLEATFNPTSMCVDGLHPNYVGAILLGQAVGDAIAAIMSPDDPCDLSLTSANIISTANENPDLVGTGGAKLGTPTPTGEVANLWSVNHNDAFEIVCSKTTLRGRTAQRLQISGTNSTNGRSVSMLNAVAYNGTVGQVYDCWWDFQLAAGAANLRAIGASSDTTSMPNVSQPNLMPADAIDGVMRVPGNAALAGSDTSTSVQFFLNFAAGVVAADIIVAAPFFALSPS